jgi:signal transduction histidine kinase
MAVLLLVVGLCSALLIIISRNNIVQLTLNSALAEQNSLQASFKGMVDYYGKNDMEPVAKRSLVKYWFLQLASNTSVLVMGDETIYSDISMRPEALLPLGKTDDQQYYIGTSDGGEILITGNKINILSDDYSIYTVSDITDVYNSINKMIIEIGAISLLCIVVGMALIFVLVRYAIRPLRALGLSARRIAKGEYSERAQINKKTDEIGALAQDFNAMAEAVQSHINELNDNAQRQQFFIGGLTHEFKTPLTSVIGHSETLLFTKMPEDVIQNSLAHILEQCRRLERLTQKMLRLITLQENIELYEESVPELLDSVKSSMDEVLRQRQINLSVSCDTTTLPVDFDLMQSLLINLVDNAAKASKEGQTIELRAHGSTISVADHGAGIPKDEIPCIFEPFYRVDKSRSRQSGGAGLGLALVQRIAQAHGAQIFIESIVNYGTTVKVVFPVYK